MSSIETTIKNSIGEIARVVALVEELAAVLQLPASAIWPLNVALDEILSNIISYGHEDGHEHDILIRVSLEQGLMVAEVEDDGRAFDPLTAPAPAIDVPLEERGVGGLGIHIVRNLMDEVTYQRTAGRNRLTLKRALVRNEGEGS